MTPDGSVESETRVVVEGRWDGDIIPATMAELGREVIIRPGSTVTGCVFGRRVSATGPFTVERAMYATDELQVELEGESVVESGLASRTLVSVSGAGSMTIYGDVQGSIVRLNNCAVKGSVLGDEVHLTNCMVLGAVHGKSVVDLDGTIALTVDGEDVRLGGECGLMLPYARGSQSLKVTGTIRLLGFPSEQGRLSSKDVVQGKDNRLHLIVGRRLTDVAQAKEGLAVIRKFLSGIALAGVTAEGDTPRLTSEQLPEELQPWAGREIARGVIKDDA